MTSTPEQITLREDANCSKIQSDTVKAAEFAFFGVLIPLVAILGVVGNVLILVVMTRRPMVGPTNSLLAALAVSDTALLLLQIPYYSVVHGSLSSQSYSPASSYYWITWYVVSHVFLTTTCWLTTAVVIERFLSFRSNKHTPLKTIHLVVFAIFLIALLIHLSKSFEYGPITDLCAKRPMESRHLVTVAAYVKARTTLYAVLVVLLPVVLMIVFNSFLLRYLIRHRRQMKLHGETSVLERQHVQSVGMSVFAVVFIFVLCNTPEVYNSLNLAVHDLTVYQQDSVRIAGVYLKSFLAVVNSSVNFLVYVALNRKFRKTLEAVLGKYAACKAVGKMCSSVFGRCCFTDGMRQGSSLRRQAEAEGQGQQDLAAAPLADTAPLEDIRCAETVLRTKEETDTGMEMMPLAILLNK